MSVSGISSSNFFYNSLQSVQDRMKQFRQEFQQLGEDLQSGNLSAAQADFASLQQLGPQAGSTSATQSDNPIAQDFDQLSQDLQAGNISAAQQDYAKVQQDFRSPLPPTFGRSPLPPIYHHHHRHFRPSASGDASPFGQLFDQLGQALQSGNLSAAQQAYSALLQDFQQLGQSGDLTSGQSSSQSNSSGISVNA